MISEECRSRYANMADIQLVECILQNDELAVEFLFFEKCKSMFKRLSFQIFNGEVELNEIIGEFYLFMRQNEWSKLRSYEGRATLLTWLTVIAVRFFVQKKPRLTKMTSNGTLNIDEISQEIKLLSSEGDRVGRFELMDAIMHICNHKYRWVLLAEINGLNPEEMASQLNTTVCNIYNYKKRAKIALVELLNEWKNV